MSTATGPRTAESRRSTALVRALLAAAAIPAAALLGLAVLGRLEPVVLAQAAAAFAATAFLVRRAAASASIGFGLANRITLWRAALTCLCVGFVGQPGLVAEFGWLLAGTGALALALDGLDGHVARRRGEASAFGARFDMEVDSALILVLALLAMDRGLAPWVLMSGLMRYGFVAAGRLFPALTQPLPPSFRRRAVCALQGAALVVCLVPAVPLAAAGVVAAVALGLLTLSFALDVGWLLGRRARSGAVAGLALAVLLPAADATAEPARYEIDPKHFSVGFLVDHIGYARTLGMFTKAGGSFLFDEATGALSDVRIVVDTSSVFTNDARRDDHLRGRDFLNAGVHPEMVFTATGMERTGERTGRLQGALTLLGQTRDLGLDVTWNKSGPYPFGGGALNQPPYVTGISARGSFRRSDFGMTYAVDNGWVGDEIELIIEFEAVRQE